MLRYTLDAVPELLECFHSLTGPRPPRKFRYIGNL